MKAEGMPIVAYSPLFCYLSPFIRFNICEIVQITIFGFLFTNREKYGIIIVYSGADKKAPPREASGRQSGNSPSSDRCHNI